MAKPIDALLLAHNDWANTMYRFWMCLKHLGLNVVAFKGNAHPFGYPEQAPIHPSLANKPLQESPVLVMAPGLESLIESSHVVHLFACTFPMTGCDLKQKNVVVQHGSSAYRNNPKECNAVFNLVADKTVIQCPDLLGLGAVNESLIYYPVDTDFIKPDYSRRGEKLIVGHFPSNPKVKGTDRIVRTVKTLLEGYDFEFRLAPGLVKWETNLKRMAECDVIIEGCNPEINGKVYGEWGNTALEAAAAGCVVITHHTHQEVYRENYGAMGLMVANDEAELMHSLETLLLEKDLSDRKRSMREWAEKHSIPTTSERLWETTYKDFF